MRVLIVYATTEGHTRDLCRFIMRTLADDGRQAVIEEAPRDTSQPSTAARR